MQRLKKYPQCVWFVANGRVMVGPRGGPRFAVTAAKLVMVIGLNGVQVVL